MFKMFENKLIFGHILVLIISSGCQAPTVGTRSNDLTRKNNTNAEKTAVIPAKDDGSAKTSAEGTGKTITVGVFFQNTDGTYMDSQKSLIFDSEKECQTWSRTTQGDSINPAEHLHYNAAKNVSYKDGTFSWTEIGPEHSQQDIDTVCAQSNNGASKSVNSTDYTQDKRFYLKILKVE